MAADCDAMACLLVVACTEEFLEPPSPSLQNCIQRSTTWKYFSILCDFGVVLIIEIKESTGASVDFKAVLVDRLSFGKGETLEGHAWSSDDELFAVAGHKLYLFKVSEKFSKLHSIPLYFIPKDISFILSGNVSCQGASNIPPLMYSLAVAGPNGVDLYEMAFDGTIQMGESLSLHSDLAIALVQFSPDKKYLAVAALDCHFGIWTVSSLDTDQKEFWYIHLKTLRITSLEFSSDSSMVAVAGWEGSWHLYRKISDGGNATWHEFHHGTGTERVPDNVPGSFITWSPDNRFVRLTQSKEKKYYLLTFDTQNSISSTISLEKAAKGIASFRGTSGDYSLCLLKSRQYLTLKWPMTTSRHGHHQTTSVLESKPRLLLSKDTLLGTLKLEYSQGGEVALLWRPSSKENIVVMRRIVTGERHPEEQQQLSVMRPETFPISGSCGELSRIKAPFGPALLESRLIESVSRRSLPQVHNDATILVSSKYIVVAILPLLAYVYEHQTKQWKTLLLPPLVVDCCVAGDNCLVLLTSDGGIRCWCLSAMKLLLTVDEVLHGIDDASQRWVVFGDPFQAQVTFISLDLTGKGVVFRLHLKPGEVEERLSIQRLAVCFPALFCRGRASCACCSLGHLMIFKTTNRENCRETVNYRGSKQSEFDQWTVIVPELEISRSFLEESGCCSVEQFIARHQDALCRMEALAVAC